jgi:hypothetical protein
MNFPKTQIAAGDARPETKKRRRNAKVPPVLACEQARDPGSGALFPSNAF